MRIIDFNRLKQVSVSILMLLTLLSVGFFIQQRQKVDADVPLAARLLAEPYESTGVRVTVTNSGNLYGLATDGTQAYMINSSGNVYTIPFSAISMTPGEAVSLTGTSHTVSWGQDGAPSWPGAANLSLAYSHGCLFITNNNNTLGQIRLYCIDISDYTVTEIAVPEDKPLPVGYYYVISSLIDFPDGRIGKVSQYEGSSTNWTSTLRTYTVTGTGKDVEIAWSEDYIMADTAADNFARDEHGIATDGTYLYRIQWRDVGPYNYKSWTLASGEAASVSYAGQYTMPFGNMHFLAHNHIDNYYLVGHWNSNQFFITTAADPGPGPGNPLTPTFGSITRTTNGFTVQITNYDATFTWDAEVSTGSVNVSDTGLLTVTGLEPEENATIVVSATKTGVPDGEAEIEGTSLGVDLNGDGTEDSEQDNVSAILDDDRDEYVVLEIDDSCAFDTSSLETEDSMDSNDSGYSYPLGMLGFTATCGSPGFTATIKQYYYNVPENDYILRKFINSNYITIADATIEEDTINSQPVLVITYDVTDGGELDVDGIENSVIVDPAGPAIAQAIPDPTDDNDDSPLAQTGIKLPLSAILFVGSSSAGLLSYQIIDKKKIQYLITLSRIW